MIKVFLEIVNFVELWIGWWLLFCVWFVWTFVSFKVFLIIFFLVDVFWGIIFKVIGCVKNRVFVKGEEGLRILVRDDVFFEIGMLLDFIKNRRVGWSLLDKVRGGEGVIGSCIVLFREFILRRMGFCIWELGEILVYGSLFG